MRALILLFLLVSTQVYGQKKEGISRRLDGVDKELTKVLKTWDAAGFAVAVVEKNEVVYAKGFGYRDVENKLPATPNTLFAIGSCSKSFTAAILGILENEGKLSLEDSPREHVPGLTFSTNELNSLVTIKDMMSHRTGLPRHDYSWYFFPTNSKDSLIARIRYQQPFAEIREKWYYNNFMFLTQGVIAEKLTEKSWEDNIRDRFFLPLGMSTSNLTIDELEESIEPAFGYQVKDGDIEKMDYYRIAAMGPAGSINSSVNEMSRWVITWINGGKYQGKQLIPADYVKQAISSQMVVGSGLPDEVHPDVQFSTYGFGWFLASYKGHYRVEHGGNINGFSASTSFFPTDSVGIVVLSNQNGSRVPTIVRNIISDRILGVEETDWNKEMKKRADKQQKEQKEKDKEAEEAEAAKPTGLPTHGVADYAGTYAHPGYGAFAITEEGGELIATFPLIRFVLKHVRFDVFDLYELKEGEEPDTSGDGALTFNFQTDNDGQISRLTTKIEPALDPLIFTRKKTN